MVVLDDIARRICDFLREALEEGQPERDVPLAEQIMADLVATLPIDDPGWSQGIERVADIVAAELQERPEVWPQAIRLVDTYFDSTKLGSAGTHPRLSPVELAVPLVRRLVERATPAARRSLFEHSKEWEILCVLIEPLLLLDLSSQEVSMLLGPADTFTQRDIHRGQYVDPFHDWAGRNPEIAKDIVERWLLRESDFVDLGHRAIEVLVEGVVAHHGGEVTWRDRVVDSLLSRSRDAASWQLGAYLACFAWPEDSCPPPALRHATLRKHVERWPERMLISGLDAMRMDAVRHPAEALNTSLELLVLWPREERDPEQRALVAVGMCSVATVAVWAITDYKIEPAGPIPWSSVLEAALDVPPGYASKLDELLDGLTEIDRHSVQDFLPRWLREHAGALFAEYRDLESILPNSYNHLGHDGMSRILVQCAVQPDARLRHIAIALMNRGNSAPVDDSFFELSDTQVRAFVHETVGTWATGDFWIPLVLRLGRMRPGILAELTDILIADAVPNYPGLCRKYFHVWSSPEGDGPASAPASQAAAVEQAHRALFETLEQRERTHEHKLTVAEIRTTLPAADYWAEIQNRMMQQSFERQRRFASPFLARIPTQPIARGEATMAGTAGFRVPFGEISTSFELPIRDSMDLVAAALARHAHRRRAAELLSGEPAESVP